MLFNSYVFLLAFLPVSLLGFSWIGRHRDRAAAHAWLFGCSLFFYAWWDIRFLLLLLPSIGFNFALGEVMVRLTAPGRARRNLLTLGIGANLALIGYFKYWNFFLTSAGTITGTPFEAASITLPLGISFFTFQQIAFLVDAYRGEAHPRSLLTYGLFVSFFPQLVAGPIVHHREMMPQFAARTQFRLSPTDLSVGLTIFVIGLFKKVMLADPISRFASPTFAAAELGVEPALAESWIAALAYTLQLYFDFSGYSDMAIGLGRCFGIRLPLNFNSPYKATSIADFWRRWHMTLSRFLRDYVYIPLGGNRRGTAWRYSNLLTTMLVGGLWHGAGWTFIVWGGLHGLLLALNHAWRSLRGRLGIGEATPRSWRRAAGRAATFLAVVVAWVIFRADSFDGATRILLGMCGGNGLDLDTPFEISRSLRLILPLLCWVWFAPNTQEVMAAYEPALGALRPAETPRGVERWLRWGPSPLRALLLAGMAVIAILNLSSASEFLYYQF